MNPLITIISIGFKSHYFKGLTSKQPKSNIMKKLLFIIFSLIFSQLFSYHDNKSLLIVTTEFIRKSSTKL